MKRYGIVLGVLVFTAMLMILASPATATENKLLFVPSSVTGYGGGCVDVDIYTDINETDQAIATQFDIEYDLNCVQDYPSFDNTISPWINHTYSNPSPGVCRITTTMENNAPISGHIYVGTLTLCCNSTDCESSLNFTNALYVTGDVNSTSPSTDNGTFQCEECACGDVDGWEGVSPNDGWLVFMNATSLPGDPRYQLTSTWAADCDGWAGISPNDGWLIFMNATSLPGDPRYILQCA